MAERDRLQPGYLWRRLGLPQRVKCWLLALTAAVAQDGRAAREKCPLLLVVVGGGSSDPAAIRGDGPTDGGSHNPSRIELPGEAEFLQYPQLL